jgi:hypothetical protein
MKNYVLVLAVLLSFPMYAQTEVAGIELPSSVQIETEKVDLNGAGVREKFWIDLYAGGLYLAESTDDANEVIKAKKPMGIKIHIVSKLISSSKMKDAVEDGFQSSTDENTAPLRDKIDKFISFFEDEIVKNDVFDIYYHPDSGVKVSKNNELKGTIKGKSFKEALFGIWFCDDPADDDLKEAMLGKG